MTEGNDIARVRARAADLIGALAGKEVSFSEQTLREEVLWLACTLIDAGDVSCADSVVAAFSSWLSEHVPVLVPSVSAYLYVCRCCAASRSFSRLTLVGEFTGPVEYGSHQVAASLMDWANTNLNSVDRCVGWTAAARMAYGASVECEISEIIGMAWSEGLMGLMFASLDALELAVRVGVVPEGRAADIAFDHSQSIMVQSKDDEWLGVAERLARFSAKHDRRHPQSRLASLGGLGLILKKRGNGPELHRVAKEMLRIAEEVSEEDKHLVQSSYKLALGLLRVVQR